MDNPRSKQRLTRICVALFLAGLGWPSPASACQVPVFRYALERTESAPYRAIIFHRGPLSKEDQALVDVLDKAAKDNTRPANIQAQTVDLGGSPAPWLVELHKKIAPAKLPRVALVLSDEPEDPLNPAAQGPQNTPQNTLIWNGALSRDTVAKLLDSPVRREIARRLLQGESAVWLVVESGDATKDKAAKKTIAENLAKLKKQLVLPGNDPADGPPKPPVGADGLEGPAIPLRLAFSTIELPRQYAAEEVLIKMLMATSAKPLPEKEPAVFIIYGRGRVLGGLAGKDIDLEPMTGACEFLVGDCSCSIKDRMPGVGLLMSVDWFSHLQGDLTLDKALPPLAGLPPQTMESSKPSPPAAAPKR